MKLLTWLRNPEAIGNPECPLMRRWTIFSGRRCKLLVHHFLPDTDDPDIHDHPRPFVTIVLRGSYDDMVTCPWPHLSTGVCVAGYAWASGCGGSGRIVGEHMRAGMIRRRRAEHSHSTRTDARGCWTVCIMGRETREWGFWRMGEWWPWRRYIEKFGIERRCP